MTLTERTIRYTKEKSIVIPYTNGYGEDLMGELIHRVENNVTIR